MGSIIGLLIIVSITLAFCFGFQSYKNHVLIKQIQGMTHVYEMISQMYNTLIDTVMQHEGVDITPYLDKIMDGGNMNG